MRASCLVPKRRKWHRPVCSGHFRHHKKALKVFNKIPPQLSDIVCTFVSKIEKQNVCFAHNCLWVVTIFACLLATPLHPAMATNLSSGNKSNMLLSTLVIVESGGNRATALHCMRGSTPKSEGAMIRSFSRGESLSCLSIAMSRRVTLSKHCL